ncbi:MAG: methyltransferase domain-containing protein [Hyphomicrobiales bacterium]|nr:methyltransferase domain-containing protein [Hyphomicrobiales bacterium]
MGNRLVSKFGDRLEFARGLVTKPKTVGAIAPTSARMAVKMASLIRPDSGLPVLELGPGTGVITKAILDTGVKPENIYSIEYSASFIPGLKRRFSGINFIQGDAFNIKEIAEELGIKQFECVISALPLLNFPISQRVRLVVAALKLVEHGRPLVQFSYGPRPPVPERTRNFNVDHLGTVLRNIPPARIWTYTCSKQYPDQS